MLLKDSDLIIFDLDGVLIDSKKMWLYIHQKVLKEQGYNYSYKEIESYLGQKTKKVISDLIPKEDKERIKKIKKAKIFADGLSSEKETYEKVKLLPFVKETIEKLKRKNYNLALLTNSNRVFVKAILKRFSLKDFWSKIIAADDGFETKEDATLFLIKYFNTKPERTVYIGDMIRDVNYSIPKGIKLPAL